LKGHKGVPGFEHIIGPVGFELYNTLFHHHAAFHIQGVRTAASPDQVGSLYEHFVVAVEVVAQVVGTYPHFAIRCHGESSGAAVVIHNLAYSFYFHEGAIVAPYIEACIGAGVVDAHFGSGFGDLGLQQSAAGGGEGQYEAQAKNLLLS
jgi:hypothetical protein